LIILFLLTTSARALDVESPVVYPIDENVKTPVFFWQDINNLPLKSPLSFSLSIFSEDGNYLFFKVFKPAIHDGFYIIRPNIDLEPGIYSYHIKALRNGIETDLPFYRAYHYPIKGQFSCDLRTIRASDDAFVDWYTEHHFNKIENGYNSIFFASSGTATGICAYLLLCVFDWNIWTRIIGYLFAASSVTGFGASAYYGTKYFYTSGEIDRRYEMSKSSSTQGILRVSFNQNW
jgi:hypothetical protein